MIFPKAICKTVIPNAQTSLDWLQCQPSKISGAKYIPSYFSLSFYRFSIPCLFCKCSIELKKGKPNTHLLLLISILLRDILLWVSSFWWSNFTPCASYLIELRSFMLFSAYCSLLMELLRVLLLYFVKIVISEDSPKEVRLHSEIAVRCLLSIQQYFIYF